MGCQGQVEAGAGSYLTTCSDHEEITVICKKLVEKQQSRHGHVTISFHFINHGKIMGKSRRNIVEIMKKSWSRYQIWWKITITSRCQIYGRGKTLLLRRHLCQYCHRKSFVTYCYFVRWLTFNAANSFAVHSLLMAFDYGSCSSFTHCDRCKTEPSNNIRQHRPPLKPVRQSLIKS